MLPIRSLLNHASRPEQYVFHLIEAFAKEQESQANDAIVEGSSKISYAELNHRANELAHFLLAKKRKPETRVALYFKSSIDYIVSLLAVMKAGYTFMPLSTNAEGERLKEYLNNSNVEILLSSQQLKMQWPFLNTDLTAIETHFLEEIDFSGYPTKNPECHIQSSQLAYIHNTSGTTGKPKKVLINHAGILNMATDIIARMAIEPADHLSWFADVSFDAHICEILIALCAGSTLYIVPNDIRLHFPKLKNFYQKKKITVSILTPSILSKLHPNDFPHLRALITTGEATTSDSIAKWAGNEKHPIRFFNGYGPAEVTVATSLAELKPEETIHIGEPIKGLKLHVLEIVDEAHPRFNVPRKINAGEQGELYISGIGLGRGYSDEKLTAQKFRSIQDSEDNSKQYWVYQTRDAVTLTQDNKIQITGRLDRQIKVYGKLICPEEIEERLKESKEVLNAYVDPKINPITGHPQFTAYIVPTDSENFHLRDLYLTVAPKLPAALAPVYWVVVDNMVFSQSGKNDLKSLTTLTLKKTRIRPDDAIAMPAKEAKKLSSIWTELLEIQEPDFTFFQDDNFFHLGGTSIQAADLITRLYSDYNLKLTLTEFSACPTFGTLVRKVQRVMETKQEINKAVPLNMTTGTDAGAVPLFLIHSLLGEAKRDYEKLMENGSFKRPVYGISARQSEHLTELDNDLSAIAYDYIRSIKLIRPQGPYLVGGWSAGGLISYAIATILRAQGQSVSLLIFDSLAIATYQTKTPAAYANYLFTLYTNKLISLLKLPQNLLNESFLATFSPPKQILHLVQTITDYVQQTKENTKKKIGDINIIGQLLTAFLNYRNHYQAEDIMLWAAEESWAETPKLGWPDNIKFNEIKVLPHTNHDSILLDPASAKLLAEQIKTYCEKQLKKHEAQAIIDKLRETNESQIDKEELRYYIPVMGYNNQSNKDEDIYSEVQRFLQSEKQVFLLLGSSGSGKTLFCQFLAQELKSKPGPIPLYIPLGSFEDPTKELVENKLRREGYSDDQIKILRDAKQPIVLLWDGYEESHKGVFQNLFATNRLDQWGENVKIIISCRTSLLADAPNYRTFFIPTRNGKMIDAGLREMTISSFNQSQINAYVRKYLSIPREEELTPDTKNTSTWDEQKYHQYINDFPGLRSLITTPFILRILMEVLPMIAKDYENNPSKEKLLLTVTMLYDYFAKMHYERQANKLAFNNMLPADGRDLKLDFKRFSQRLAIAMTEKSLFQVYYQRKTDPLFEDEEVKASEWDKFFDNKNSNMVRAREGALIKPVHIKKQDGFSFECWSFLHYSFQEFCASTELFENSLKKDIAKIYHTHSAEPQLDEFVIIPANEKKSSSPSPRRWSPSLTEHIGSITSDEKKANAAIDNDEDEEAQLQKAIAMSLTNS